MCQLLTTIDRLRAYLEAEGIPFARVENDLGLSNGYLRTLKKSIGSEKLALIIRRFTNLNTEWLLLGRGEMYKEEVVNEDTSINTNLSNDFEKLSDDHQKIIAILEDVNRNYATTSNAVLSLLTILGNIQNDTKQICEEHKNHIIATQNLILDKLSTLINNNTQRTGIEVSGGEKVSVQFGGNSTTNIK